MGGEEFAIILPDYNLERKPTHLLDKHPPQPGGTAATAGLTGMVHIAVTFSAGLAERKRHSNLLSELLKIADHAMYQAKQRRPQLRS